MTRTAFHKPIRATKAVHHCMDGSCIRFDSKTEYAYWQWGQRISTHVCKTSRYFEIEGGSYRPDFEGVDNQGIYFIEVKGIESDIWRRTKKQLRERYPNLRLLIVFGRADKKRGFVTTKQEWLNEESEGKE